MAHNLEAVAGWLKPSERSAQKEFFRRAPSLDIVRDGSRSTDCLNSAGEAQYRLLTGDSSADVQEADLSMINFSRVKHTKYRCKNKRECPVVDVPMPEVAREREGEEREDKQVYLSPLFSPFSS